MNLETLDTRWAINRNKALASAGEAIIEARKLLDQLEKTYKAASMGELPKLDELVSVCHALGEAKNNILVGFIESSAVPQEKTGTLKPDGPTTIGWSSKKPPIVKTPLTIEKDHI